MQETNNQEHAKKEPRTQTNSEFKWQTLCLTFLKAMTCPDTFTLPHFRLQRC